MAATLSRGTYNAACARAAESVQPNIDKKKKMSYHIGKHVIIINCISTNLYTMQWNLYFFAHLYTECWWMNSANFAWLGAIFSALNPSSPFLWFYVCAYCVYIHMITYVIWCAKMFHQILFHCYDRHHFVNRSTNSQQSNSSSFCFVVVAVSFNISTANPCHGYARSF